VQPALPSPTRPRSSPAPGRIDGRERRQVVRCQTDGSQRVTPHLLDLLDDRLAAAFFAGALDSSAGT
jgi:hypothetical protein